MELPSTQRPTLPGPTGSQEQGGEALAPIWPWLILFSYVALLGHSLLLPAMGSPHPDHASRSMRGLDTGLLGHVLGRGPTSNSAH